MSDLTGTAVAHPNIAFIKYWGNINDEYRMAANDSLSMNLGDLETRTTVLFSDTMGEGQQPSDSFILNDVTITGAALERVSRFLDLIRELAGKRLSAHVISRNNFPTGAGVASSAAAFAALSTAAVSALELELDEKSLSRLARRGSGSACRSIPSGFVEWHAGETDEDSFAFSIAPPDHWNLVDCVAVISAGHKPVGSTQGHALAHTSPLQHARLASAPERVAQCRGAIITRDFEQLARVVELDSNIMHAVMQTSTPPLFYWEPLSVKLMKLIPEWRKKGIPVCYTLDAGPNVHVITERAHAENLKRSLLSISGVEDVLTSGVGGAAAKINQTVF
ncbi:MAG: diphosphomevalonate decarboxylase [Anaerolineaceae bacterium]|nr:diphosphomevalonate decarboxylase [Anaerolineaceae bacterium]